MGRWGLGAEQGGQHSKVRSKSKIVYLRAIIHVVVFYSGPPQGRAKRVILVCLKLGHILFPHILFLTA